MKPFPVALSTLGLLTCAAFGQAPVSSTHQLESVGFAAGGGIATSPTHQIQATVGQSTPLAIDATIVGDTGRVQPGLVPTLYPRTLLGDSNQDGTRDAADVVTSVEIALGRQAAPVEIVAFFNADANTDGQITSADVTATVNAILGR